MPKTNKQTKASILRRSAFFTVQLSHLYMTTGKIRALTRRTFVGKVMYLFLNMLSRLVTTFLLRSESTVYDIIMLKVLHTYLSKSIECTLGITHNVNYELWIIIMC